MKSEERHQLLTNDLGVVTNKTVGFFERHLETVIAAVCAVFVLAAFIFWWTQTSDSDNAAGWSMLDSARNLQEFGNVADRFKGKLPGQWAQLKIAEKTSQDALPLMFTNRELAKAELKSAREGFEALVQDKSVDSQIRERSLWGLALCLEALCDGDTSKPIEAFERLITDFPETIFKAVAEERIAALKKDDAKAFYAWFSQENPKQQEARPDEFQKDGFHLPSPKFGDEDMDDEPADAAVPDQKNNPPADQSQTTTPPDGKSDEEKKQGDKPEVEKAVEPAKPAEGEKPPTTEAPKEGEKPAENK